MKILLTGATGYIGSAVAQAARHAGHDVVALTHSPESARRVCEGGWEAVPGDLRDAALLAQLAGAVDAVIHAAIAGGADAAEVDTVGTRAFLASLAGSGKAFVYTSGAWVLGPGRSDERSKPQPAELVAWRPALERAVRAAAPGVRAVVLRPAIVYGHGGGIPGMLARGDLPLIGSGRQRWPLVHVEDLADLYVRALNAPPGAILHGVGTTLTMRELALLARAGQSGVEALSLSEARTRFGSFADALALDQAVDARRTRDLLDWSPRMPSPIEALLDRSRAAA